MDKLDVVNAATSTVGGTSTALEMDDNHWNTLRTLLDAITELPNVAERVEAFMMGRGIEDPHIEIQALIDISGL